MKRRQFLKSAMAVAAASTPRVYELLGQTSAEPDAEVRRVLVVFMCHLDIGFTATQEQVMHQYFSQFYPQAIEVAAKLRDRGTRDRYRWTTCAWLLYEYLEQASTAELRQMERAVLAGDVEWHAMPFNWQTEALDRSMIDGCMGFSAALDSRFGKKTIGGKMTDVPGHSRGLVSVLANHNVQLLDIGVNPASTPPGVPEVFVWKAPEDASIVMLYHPHAYGGVTRIPNSDLAIDIEIRVDNTGPHSESEISEIYATLRRRFPNAEVIASSFSEIAAAVKPIASRLPVITQEIGDTWIYGIPSDPGKMARYREVARLRNEWIRNSSMSVGDRNDLQLLRRLALAPEHTWGTDTKRYIDHEHYPPRQLAQFIDTPGYQTMEHSWQEKRDDIDRGIANLPESFRSEALDRLRLLQIKPPVTSGMTGAVPGEVIRTAHFDLLLDPSTGAISGLTERRSNHPWASPATPLALFSYQTLAQVDYTHFLNSYVLSKEWWAPQDFGKPNIDKFPAESRSWNPTLQQLWKQENAQGIRILSELAIHDTVAEQKGLVAWPQTMFMDLWLPHSEAVLEMSFLSFGKAPNRMPEAMWLTFVPRNSGSADWILDKVDQEVRADDVVRGGSRRMHAVTNHVTCRHQGRQFRITTLDAPVIAMGEKSPLNYSAELPDMKQGIHICLFNNAWGTNYVQWAGGDWMYRFRLSV